MIISASRRTDIPALYVRWFMNRIRAGWCAVPNPMNTKQVSYVSLDPTEVDAIVFWSKNPAPLLPHIQELDSRGFRYYFQFTLNDYPRDLEPHVPSLASRLKTFLKLSERLGSQRVIWRYDPIIISNVTDHEFHRERFSRIAEELEGATTRAMVSVVDFYQKTDRRLTDLGNLGFSFDKEAATDPDTLTLLRDIAMIALDRKIEVFTCAEDPHLNEIGIAPGSCIDAGLINRIWKLNLPYKKDPTQRGFCQCAASKDIGINDTCTHGCVYCYSTRNSTLGKRRFREHDSNSPAIWGAVNLSDPKMGVPQQMRLFTDVASSIKKER